MLGDWLGRYRVTTRVGFFLPHLGSESLLVMIWGSFGHGDKGAQSASEATWVLGYAPMALVQGLAPVALGQDSASPSLSFLICKMG